MAAAAHGEQVGKVFWSDLRAHAARGGLIVVGGELGLAEVGEALASDDARRVEGWLATGALGKPTLAQLTAWEHEAEAVFEALIVQPWVLLKAPVSRP